MQVVLWKGRPQCLPLTQEPVKVSRLGTLSCMKPVLVFARPLDSRWTYQLNGHELGQIRKRWGGAGKYWRAIVHGVTKSQAKLGTEQQLHSTKQTQR